MKSRVKKGWWMVVGGLLGAILTLHLQTNALTNSVKVPLPVDELQRLALVFGLVKNNYVEEVDEKKVISDAIAGMVSGLDPHSQYLDAKEYEDFKEGYSGKFVGLGIEITKDDLGIKIVAPIEDSPAAKVGLLAGDIITKIDTESAKELTLTAAVKKMRGEKDTAVKLEIYRSAEKRSFDIEIIRQPINVKSVKSKILADGYGWIRIVNFQENTIPDFALQMQKLYQKSPQMPGLVLDLRNDPGGLLYDAIGIASAFLEQDLLVVSIKGQNIKENKQHFASPKEYTSYLGGIDPLAKLPASLKTIPLVVLVNEGSASASEIVAGALQDHKRALIMGSTTFGKGSVQNVQPLPGGTALKLTIARYFTPNGVSIQAKGIEPDVALDDFAEGSPYALLRTREADLSKHLSNETEDDKQARKQREQEREALLKQLEQDAKNNKLLKYPELGSDEDFPLQQALNQLKGLPVKQAAAPAVIKVSAKDTTEAAEDSSPKQETSPTELPSQNTNQQE